VRLAILGALCSIAHADPKQAGVDATAIVPLSPWKRATGTGGGGMLWLHIAVSPYVEVTARLGAVVHATRGVDGIPDSTQRLSEIPLLGGARYRLTDGFVRGYLEGEVGLIFARTDVDIDGTRDNTAPIQLGSSLGACIEVGRFDLRLAVWFADLSDLDHAIGVTASIGGRVISW